MIWVFHLAQALVNSEDNGWSMKMVSMSLTEAMRTVPHLWAVCDDMLSVCPQAVLLQYVNPMAINTWAINARYPTINQVGLCHSVEGTSEGLARDLGRDINTIRYRAAGIKHMAFF